MFGICGGAGFSQNPFSFLPLATALQGDLLHYHICVHVQCSPFISGSALPDKLVSDTL